MKLEYSPDGHLLYLQLRGAAVAETAEVEPGVDVDRDANGAPLGVEFTNADDSFPFLRRLTPDLKGVMELPRTFEALLARRLEQAEATERAVAAL